MLTGLSQDWPLSREEKKFRLLRLYDRDLKETDNLLQMSSRQHTSPTGSGKDANLSATDSKENIGDNFNASPAGGCVKIPGIIDDDDENCTSPAASRCKASPLKEYGSFNIPTPPAIGMASPKEYGSWNIPTPPAPALAAGLRPAGVPRDNLQEFPSAQLKLCPTEDAPSSQGSGRSSEFLTPQGTPHAPSGNSFSLAPPPLPQNPSAPAGEPRTLAGKDFSVCKRTGTVIPSIPPMPSKSLRNTGKGESPPDQVPVTSELFSPDHPQSARPRRSSSQAAALPRRPSSATAENAFSAYRSSSRDVARASRRSAASRKEECHPDQVLSAARHGRYTEVENALAAGFLPNYADSYGNTLFHIACQNGTRRVAKLVVKYGCDMNLQNSKGNTGLHFLFTYGYPEMAEYFISKGADERIQNTIGNEARAGIR